MKTSEKMLSTLGKPRQTVSVLACLAVGLLGSALAVGLLGSALLVSTAYAQRNSNQPSSSWVGSQPVSLQTNASSSQASNTAQTPSTSSAVSEKPNGKAFPSAAAAAAALCHAVRNDDNAELLAILGPGAKDLIDTGDEANEQSQEKELQRVMFIHKYDQMHRLVKEPDDTVALYVGAENWPLPIPIVEYNGSWYFDAKLGKQEIMYRQIGRNEMEALGVCDALVDAEKEYFGLDHTYTTKFVSSAGSHDGLYWKSGDTNTRSPIGHYLAVAGVTDSTENHQPFRGYFYRVVLGASGTNGSTGGSGNDFVVVAFPAEYRSSGVMTFFVDASGNAYEKDLGPHTASAAMQITSAHPDNTWNKAAEQAAEK
jgi:hypothetical protein